jgi:hypothetical protein
VGKSRFSVYIQTNTSNRDIVDTTTYDPATDGENPDIILKVLCGAVNRRLDNLALSPSEYSPNPAQDPLNPVSSTPVFHSSETPAQSDGSYQAPAPAPARVSAPARIIPGDCHEITTDGDEIGLGIHWSYIPTIRTTSPPTSPRGGDEENLEPIQQKAEPYKVFDAWGSPPTYTWTYSNPYPKALAVVSLACVVLYFAGLYYQPTTSPPTPPG